MSQGFKPAVRSLKEDPGYETIFEKIQAKTGGESKSYEWYKQQIYSLSKDLKLILEERRDSQQDKKHRDENELRLFPLQGRLYFFDYKATTKYLPYYDKFPLVYVIGVESTYFWGANLHYLPPKKRVYAINGMKKGKLNVPKNIVHKYLKKNTQDFYLDLAINEWETAILLPVEDFVLQGKVSTPYDKEDVWKELKSSTEKLKLIVPPREYSR